jgi:hypothetical protein
LWIGLKGKLAPDPLIAAGNIQSLKGAPLRTAQNAGVALHEVRSNPTRQPSNDNGRDPAQYSRHSSGISIL